MGGQLTGLATGAWLLLNLEGVTTGIMVAALILMGRTFAPIERLINSWKSITESRQAYQDLQQLIEETSSRGDWCGRGIGCCLGYHARHGIHGQVHEWQHHGHYQ